MIFTLLFLWGTFFQCPSQSLANEKMVKIKGGNYSPFFDRSKDGKEKPTVVSPFYLDITPVTNDDYLKFVLTNKKWQRNNTKKIFADARYLNHWTGNLTFKKEDKNKAVRNVSWFAANSYCESLGKELPTILQWEFVAAADEKQPFASNTESYKNKILKWYARPSIDALPEVQKGKKNYWGVYDMHELQWEWTLNFNTALVTGESRADGSVDRQRFCGSGSLGAKDKLDYGAFMRFGFRSSLKGNYTVANLGFRCARKDKQ